MDREKQREYNRNYYKQNAEKIIERHIEWDKSNKEKVNEYRREYAKRDYVKAKKRAYLAEWRKRNPEKSKGIRKKKAYEERRCGMMMVGCWSDECKWNKNGWCHRGSITIDELKECEDFEDYRDSYTDSFWKAFIKDGNPYRKLVDNGKKIEYNGYVFYTDSKITDDESYRLTEERTGLDVGEFRKLKEQKRWEHFIERVGTFPDVLTYPEEKKVGE